VLRGIGEDAAIIRPSARRQWLITTDLLAEGVHFLAGEANAVDIGYKAALANLSDIAAMGGIPHYVLVSIAIPASRSTRDIERLYQGLMRACRTHHVELIGGDTSSSRQGLFISITLIGSVTPGRALRRDGARAGDLLYVTGTLGDSLAGLTLLTRASRNLGRSMRGLSLTHQRYLIGRHMRPSPRLRAGQLLSSLRLATSAIDISDGLAGDLSRLCEQSGIGADLETKRIPCSAALKAYCRLTRRDPTKLALQGGEDYELLFTARPGNAARLARLGRRFGCRLSCLGVIRSKRDGLRLRGPQGKTTRLTLRGYEHFHAPDDRRS
jgi:thiamine-monophosphate kinase